MRLDDLTALLGELVSAANQADNLAEEVVGSCTDNLEWASMQARQAAKHVAQAIEAHCERTAIKLPELPSHERPPQRGPFPSAW